MTIWELSEYAAWVLSALIALYLIADAVRVSRQYDEEFLVHTMEDLGELTTDDDGRASVDRHHDGHAPRGPSRGEEATS